MLLAVLLSVLAYFTPYAHSVSSPQSNRLFYLSTPRSLSISAPSTSANFTFKRAPISFNYGLLSGYAIMPQTNPVLVLDRSGIQTTNFNLNPGPNNNIVLIEASAYSAFGLSDISLNLTIVDQSLHPVLGATSRNMTSNSLSTNPQPYNFFATWLYPTNSTQGTYQVFVDIIDSQNNVAFSFRGPANFGLVPPNFVPFPYNLLPYFVVGGVGAAGGLGGAGFYRCRQR